MRCNIQPRKNQPRLRVAMCMLGSETIFVKFPNPMYRSTVKPSQRKNELIDDVEGRLVHEDGQKEEGRQQKEERGQVAAQRTAAAAPQRAIGAGVGSLN